MSFDSGHGCLGFQPLVPDRLKKNPTFLEEEKWLHLFNLDGMIKVNVSLSKSIIKMTVCYHVNMTAFGGSRQR